MFLISECRGDWDLGLSTTSGLAFGEPQRSGDFWKKTCFDAGKIGVSSCHCAAVFQTQVPKLYTHLDPKLLYILILGTYSKFARKINFLQPRASFRPVSHLRCGTLILLRNSFVKLTKFAFGSHDVSIYLKSFLGLNFTTP